MESVRELWKCKCECGNIGWFWATIVQQENKIALAFFDKERKITATQREDIDLLNIQVYGK